MPQLKEYDFQSSDKKTRIYVREWIPEGKIRASFQIAHGVAEYGARYDAFMQFLAEHGIACAVNDHLGHGRSVASEEDRLYFAEENGWNYVVRDMKTLHEHLKERYPDVPAVLFGHSMGSFLARTYIIRYPDDADMAVICGTGQQSPMIVSLGLMMANRECKKNGAHYHSESLNKMAFGSYNKKCEPQRTPADWLSCNNENVDKYIADPLCGGVASAGLFRDMMTGLKFIGNKANVAGVRKDLPVFLIAGAQDPVGGYGKGVQKVYQTYRAAGLKDVSLKLYENDRHEILNEDDKEQVYADVLGWIENHLKA